MDEILEALDNDNHEDMYLSDTEVDESKPKKKPTGILNYIKLVKDKISKFFLNYLKK